MEWAARWLPCGRKKKTTKSKHTQNSTFEKASLKLRHKIFLLRFAAAGRAGGAAAAAGPAAGGGGGGGTDAGCGGGGEDGGTGSDSDSSCRESWCRINTKG